MKKKTLIAVLLASCLRLHGLEISQQYHLFLWTCYNQKNENIPVTQQCYNLLLRHSASPHVYPSFLEFLFNTGQYSLVVQLTPTIEKMIPLDLHSRLIFAQSLQLVGLTNEALNHFKLLTQQYAHNTEINYLAAQSYMINNDSHTALQIIDAHLQHSSCKEHCFPFYFLKAQIFVFQKQYSAARTNLHNALDIHPAFDKGWLLLAVVNELDGKITSAIENYQKYLKIAGSNPLIEQQLNRLKTQAK